MGYDGFGNYQQAVPQWLVQAVAEIDALTNPEPTIERIEPKLTNVQKGLPLDASLMTQQFGDAFETIIERICGGDTLDEAVAAYPVPLDKGRFNRWVQSSPERRSLYTAAKEYRSEVWSGKVMRIAEGKNPDGSPSISDVQRDRLTVDVLKWLMGADNKRTYGNTQQIEISQNISIRAALDDARSRREAFMSDPSLAAIEEASYSEVLQAAQISREMTDGDGTGE